MSPHPRTRAGRVFLERHDYRPGCICPWCTQHALIVERLARIFDVPPNMIVITPPTADAWPRPARRAWRRHLGVVLISAAFALTFAIGIPFAVFLGASVGIGIVSFALFLFIVGWVVDSRG